MDFGDLAREAKGKNDALITPDLKLRYATVFSVQTDGTCTITLTGSNISGVKYLTYPYSGATVAVAQNGSDFIVLGILGKAGGWVKLSDQTLSSDTASLDFASIPGDFAHLHVRLFVRSTRAATNTDLVVIRLNGDGAGHYSYQTFVATGAATAAGTGTGTDTYIYIGDMPAATSTASQFAQFDIDIDNMNAPFHRKLVSEGSSTAGGAEQMWIAGGTWRNGTDPLAEFTAIPGTGPKFLTGSRMVVYALP